MNDIKIGDIVKINELCITSGFASGDYTVEDRFEVMSIDSCGGSVRQVITRRIGFGGIGYDSFPLYMIELA